MCLATPPGPVLLLTAVPEAFSSIQEDRLHGAGEVAQYDLVQATWLQKWGGLYCAECGLKARSAGACQGYGAGCHPAMHMTSAKNRPSRVGAPVSVRSSRPSRVGRGRCPAGEGGRRGGAARQPEDLPAAPVLTARITITVPSAAGRRGLARSAPGGPHFFLPNESFSVVTRLNTGLSAVWS